MSATLPRKVFAIVIGMAVILVAIYALRPLPVPVDVGLVDRGSITVSVDEEGKTRIREIFEVSAPIAGKMLRSPIEVGDKVVANQTVVAVIQPSSPAFLDVRSRRELRAVAAAAQAAIDLAKAEVDKALSELRFAENDLRRALALSRTSVISEKAQEQAQLTVDSKKASLAIARATLELRRQEFNSVQAKLSGPESPENRLETDQCCIEVRTPVSGQVLNVVEESERVLESGTVLAQIGDPHDLEILVEVLSSDAVQVSPGAAAKIEDWGGANTLSARVSRIEPRAFTKVSALGVEEQRVNVLLDLTDSADQWQALGHGFRVFVRIEKWHGQDVLRVPLSALFRRDNSWATFRKVDGRAVLTSVEIDHRNARFAEVVAGLQADDTVILYPSDRVEDRVRVEQRE